MSNQFNLGNFARFNKANVLEWLKSQAEAVQMEHGFSTHTGWSQVEGKPTEVQTDYGRWNAYRLIAIAIEDGMIPVPKPINYLDWYRASRCEVDTSETEEEKERIRQRMDRLWLKLTPEEQKSLDGGK